MSGKVVKGSIELGNKIRLRRNELGLTIEEAASKAGVGTKTWSRYEAGGSIRRDKVLNICKTLNWNVLPGDDIEETDFDINEYKQRDEWPQGLADRFGVAAAISFVIGSDILLDNINDDLNELANKPKGTHIGELNFSWLEDMLPPQFLMNYDYDFLFYLKHILTRYRMQASTGQCFVAHTVAQELILYMIMEASEFLMEGILPYLQKEYKYTDKLLHWDEWVFDLFDDEDILTCLYSCDYLTNDHVYHFDHWREEQFYMDL